MKAMVLPRVVALDACTEPLAAVERPMPEPTGGEIRIRVRACGVCHTELDEIEGRTPPPSLPVVPGHEVVGHVAACGPAVRLHRPGDRVGVGWIHSSTGAVDEFDFYVFGFTTHINGSTHERWDDVFQVRRNGYRARAHEW